MTCVPNLPPHTHTITPPLNNRLNCKPENHHALTLYIHREFSSMESSTLFECEILVNLGMLKIRSIKLRTIEIELNFLV